MNSIPGIFNDVIGPVMGGPTNYHCTSALCIGGKFTEGLIGVFIRKNNSFEAEAGDCMAETVSAGGMAIAVLALQNLIGLICDPKGKWVEASCLGRNIMVASNAVSSANMALPNYAHLIPIEEVIP